MEGCRPRSLREDDGRSYDQLSSPHALGGDPYSKRLKAAVFEQRLLNYWIPAYGTRG